MDSNALISIHLGQAGVQMGYSCWELFCKEHSILPNGLNGPSSKNFNNSAIFSTCPKEYTNTSRAVFADLDPTYIEKLRRDCCGKLFKQNCLINGKEDAASNFAKGYFTEGNELSDMVVEAIRHQAEDADTVQGFLVYRSLGGGTGSGLSSNVIEKVRNGFGEKSPIVEFSIYPSPKLSPVIVEPYNAVLALHSCMEITRCCFLLDNTALNDMNLKMIGIRNTNFQDINNLIAQIVSGVTCGIRFSGEEDGLENILTDLVPLPRIHFPQISYAPLHNIENYKKEPVNEDDLVSSCLKPEHQAMECDIKEGKMAACSMMFRGAVNMAAADEALLKQMESSSLDFTSLSSHVVQTFFSKYGPKCVGGTHIKLGKNAAVMLSNTSSTRAAWGKLNKRFSVMYKNKAYLHHYLSKGMEEAEFHEAMIDIRALESDYETIFV